MISKKQKKLIKQFTSDWIAQFAGSSVISIEYYQDINGWHVLITFRVPEHSRGTKFAINIPTVPDMATDEVIVALYEQQAIYQQMGIHKSLVFTPMSDEKEAYWINHSFQGIK